MPGAAAAVAAAEPGEVASVSALNAKHPEFAIRSETWVDLSLLYEGGTLLKAQADRLLKKRPREDEEVFAARLDHLTYQNILGTGLGWYGAAMFEKEPEIFFDGKVPADFYDKFLNNCDGLSTTYVDFWKRCFQLMLTFADAWILTDLKSLSPDDPEPRSLEDERKLGLFDPHLVVYSPLNVINWRADEFGKLKWVVIKTEFEDQEFLQKKELVTRWHYYDRQYFRVYEDRRSPEEDARVATDTGRTAKLIKSGAHALSNAGRVPVRRASLSGGLWLANRAYLLLLDHLNQDNTLKWALFMSNLAMPIIIGDSDVSNMTMSEVGFLQFPAGTTYEWTEPEGKSFSHTAKRIESLREECFRSLNLQAQGRSMRATPAMQSGRSKVLEMAPAKQILSGMGADLRRSMQDVLKDVGDAHHDNDIQPDVRGFNFQDDMSTEEVFAVTSLMALRIPSKKFEKYIFKRLAKAWMVDANKSETDEVYKEIDTAPTVEEKEQQEFEQKVKMAEAGLRTPKPPSNTRTMPPGRGGSGPTPRTAD